MVAAIRITGVLLLVWAAVFSPPAAGLAWGPALFRALLVFHGLVLVLIRPTRLLTRAAQKGGESTPRWVWIALAGMTVVALALRLWKLDTCLWLDEIFTMVDFARPPLREVVTRFPSQNQHMLYSILAHASLRTFGESAWALRLPAVFFGVASIWALFPLARKLVGVKEALAACALMTVSYHHIWFSQNARGYMGALFFALLATWLWLEAMERHTWGWWLWYMVAAWLGLWIHMTMLFVVGGHALIWLAASLYRRKLEWKPLAAWLLCGTLTLQVYALALPEFLRDGLHEVSMPSEWTNPLWILTESLRSLRVGFAGAAVLLCGGVTALTGWLGIMRKSPRAAAAMALPVVTGAAFVLASSHNLWPRFFFFAMGFALLIAIHGAMTLPKLLLRPNAAQVTGLTIAGLMIAASALTVPRCYALPKQDYTGARDFVESNRAPGDAVVAVGLAAHAYGRYYAPQWLTANTPAELKQLGDKYPHLSLVYTLPIELQGFHPDLWQVIEHDFETVKAFPGTLGGGEVFVCRPRGRTSAAGASHHALIPDAVSSKVWLPAKHSKRCARAKWAGASKSYKRWRKLNLSSGADPVMAAAT